MALPLYFASFNCCYQCELAKRSYRIKMYRIYVESYLECEN